LKKLATECANIKFYVLLYKSSSEILQTFEVAYGKAALKNTQIYKSHKNFHIGCASVNDDSHCKQLSTSTTDENIENVCNVDKVTKESIFRRYQRKQKYHFSTLGSINANS
jgi:hypothetical protein